MQTPTPTAAAGQPASPVVLVSQQDLLNAFLAWDKDVAAGRCLSAAEVATLPAGLAAQERAKFMFQSLQAMHRRVTCWSGTDAGAVHIESTTPETAVAASLQRMECASERGERLFGQPGDAKRAYQYALRVLLQQFPHAVGAAVAVLDADLDGLTRTDYRQRLSTTLLKSAE